MFWRNNELLFKAYTNADNTGSLIDGRSTFGFCTFLKGNPLT